jgi:predicted aspartyl protease
MGYSGSVSLHQLALDCRFHDRLRVERRAGVLQAAETARQIRGQQKKRVEKLGTHVMGMFEVKVKVANLAAPSQTEEVSLLVGTGATLPWIPRATLEKLGVKAFSRLPFTLADGHRLERDTTAVLMTVDGRKGAVQVAFGEPGEEPVLGATSLEGLGFMVDPVGQKLIPRDLRQLAVMSLRVEQTTLLPRIVS